MILEIEESNGRYGRINGVGQCDRTNVVRWGRRGPNRDNLDFFVDVVYPTGQVVEFYAGKDAARAKREYDSLVAFWSSL